MSRVQTGDSFSMKFSDQQKIADLEYLLQKAAEEISKLNEQNEYLENMNLNSDSNCQEEITNLKQQLEQKQKSIKKLQIKCINYENQLRENGNRLKDSQVTIHQHKFKTNKENKENNSTRTSMCAQFNLKALEDAEQFLNEGRIYSSRIVKFQKSPETLPQTESKQETFDSLINDELKLELSNFIEYKQNLLSQVSENLEQLKQYQQQSQFNQYVQILIDNLNAMIENNRQLKDKLNQSMEQNRLLISQFKLFLKFNERPSEVLKPDLDQFKVFDQYNQIIIKLTQSLQDLKGQYKQLQLQHIESIKENQILYNKLQEQTNSDSLKELELIKNELTNIFDDVELLNQEYESQSMIQLNQINKIIDGQKIETDNTILQEIQSRISELVSENKQMKRQYVDIIFQIIARMIKDNKQQIQKKIEANQQFQDSLQWLLQSTKRDVSFETLQIETEILRQFILQPQDYQQFNYVIDIQSRLIQKLMDQMKRNNIKNVFNTDILQELRQYTQAIEGLPECLSERIDIKLLLKQ
ncbi:hypothetical protein pb186bvf_013323 [Paramecium bursaria]